MFLLLSKIEVLHIIKCKINHGSQNVLWVLTWFGIYQYFILSQRQGIQFTYFHQPMLKLNKHSGFHDLFRFWYVQEYKYGSILWLEDGNLYLRLRTMSHTIYAVKFEQTIIHQHRHLRRESQSHAPANVLMRFYPIDKSLVCLQSERMTSC